MRIAVVDDERPARSELIYQLREILPDAAIEEGDSGAQALKLAEEGRYDLFFLDINLGDISGTSLVNALKKMQPGAKIVFVTAYSEYALQAFELGVEDYIMKPFSSKRLRKVLDRVMENERSATEEKEEDTAPRRLAISYNGRTVFEDVENIVYIETYNRGCMIYTDDCQYRDTRTIGEYEKRLSTGRFFRIHKSYLINLDKVHEVFPWGSNTFCLKMNGYDDNILSISREKIKILRKLLEF